MERGLVIRKPAAAGARRSDGHRAMIGAILLACVVPAAIMLAVWAWHEVTHESGWIDVI